jgi:hypothetical protein
VSNPGTYRPDQYSNPTENLYGGNSYTPPQVAAPPTNGGWAAATILFFWPLSFVAFSRALSVPMLWAEGRHEEAYDASASVARLGKIALGIGILLTVLVIVLYVIGIVALSDAASTAPSVPSFTETPGGY